MIKTWKTTILIVIYTRFTEKVCKRLRYLNIVSESINKLRQLHLLLEFWIPAFPKSIPRFSNEGIVQVVRIKRVNKFENELKNTDNLFYKKM